MTNVMRVTRAASNAVVGESDSFLRAELLGVLRRDNKQELVSFLHENKAALSKDEWKLIAEHLAHSNQTRIAEVIWLYRSFPQIPVDVIADVWISEVADDSIDCYYLRTFIINAQVESRAVDAAYAIVSAYPNDSDRQFEEIRELQKAFPKILTDNVVSGAMSGVAL